MKLKEIAALVLGTFALNCAPVFTYKSNEGKAIVTVNERLDIDSQGNSYINFHGGPNGLAVLIADSGNDGTVDKIAFAKCDKTCVGNVYFFDYGAFTSEYRNWKTSTRAKAKEFCAKNQKQLDELGIKNPYK